MYRHILVKRSEKEDLHIQFLSLHLTGYDISTTFRPSYKPRPNTFTKTPASEVDPLSKTTKGSNKQTLAPQSDIEKPTVTSKRTKLERIRGSSKSGIKKGESTETKAALGNIYSPTISNAKKSTLFDLGIDGK